MAENLKQIIEFQAKGIQKLKGQYKDLERRTKGLEGQTKRTSGAMGGMIAKLGLTTVALYATTKAISGAIRVGRQFEKTMSNVAAISGATGQELKDLEENAKQLGATTVFTASQVAELQVEFAKLGFSGKQITNVTKDTLALASATGSELSTSAAIAGQTLRAFGLEVTDMSRVTDVMAKSFSSSALDMDKFTNSMSYVAPTAKSVGFSIEGTTAILGGLANAGISGSMAGTALRTVFLKLADSNSGLSKALGGSVKTADQLLPALKKLKDSGIDLTEMLELVDKRAISAFDVLLNSAEGVSELKTELDNAAGSAQRMADIQLDNLDGKVKLLNSAMEGLGIAISERLNDTLVGTTEGFTNLATSLTKIVQIPLSEKIMEERIEFNALIDTLKDVNTNEDSRKTHIDTLMAKYPNYIKNLDIENLSIDQLSKVQKEANDQFERNIELKAKEEILAEKKQNALLAQIEVQKQELVVNKKQDDMLQGLVFGMAGVTNTNKASQEVEKLKIQRLEELREKAKRLNEEYKEASNVLGKYTESTEEAGSSVQTFADKVAGAGDDPVSDITKTQLAFLQQFLQERQTLMQGDTFAQMETLREQTTQLTEIYEAQGKDITDIIEFYDLKRAKIMLDDETRTRAHYSTILNNFATFLGESASGQKAAAKLQQVAAMVDAYSAANQLYSDPKLTALFPLNLIAGASALAAGLANVMAIQKSISEFSAETGFDGVVNKPTMFMTGESNKAEHVSITPLESPNISGGQGAGAININISAPLVDETVVDSIIPAIERAKSANLA